jgi:ElaB/YqjD/DUF883 family membrane-anchored ribosome-binding protein
MSDASTRQLIDDLRAVVAEAEALMGSTVGEAGERVREARHRAAESVDKARARLTDLESDLGGKADAAAEEALRFVRDKPWQALGLAAAVGLIAGLVLGRR